MPAEPPVELTISVVGSGTPEPTTDSAAQRVGQLLARAGAVVVCGGLDGVMAAACRGAREAGGRTLGLLPGEDASAANPWVDVVVPTGMGQARNFLVVRAGRAVIAVGGGHGTLSEIALARKLGLPVFGLLTWRFPGDDLIHVETPEDAVRGALASLRR